DKAPPHLLPDRSHSYFYDTKGLREARFDFDTGVTVSNGGLNAPLTDMALYLAFLLGDPARKDYDVVLKRASLEAMWRGQVRVPGESGASVSMGLCFFLEKRLDRELVAHSGTQNGFLSHFFADPKARAAYIVNYNTQTGGEEANETLSDGTNTRKLDYELR